MRLAGQLVQFNQQALGHLETISESMVDDV